MKFVNKILYNYIDISQKLKIMFFFFKFKFNFYFYFIFYFLLFSRLSSFSSAANSMQTRRRKRRRIKRVNHSASSRLLSSYFGRREVLFDPVPLLAPHPTTY